MLLNQLSRTLYEIRSTQKTNIYLFTNILEGTAFLLQGLTYNEEVQLRRE